jgi:hypothetical protein
MSEPMDKSDCIKCINYHEQTGLCKLPGGKPDYDPCDRFKLNVQRCDTCYYFDRQVGTCYRFPPTAHRIHSKQVSLWAESYAESRACGEYR